jgi:hypothetical protein
MTVYETLKQVIFTDLGIWESHIITIVFTSTIAAVIAFKIVRDYHFVQLNRKNIEIKQQKLKTLKATALTVQHIMNNFLNDLLYFKMQAEELKALDQENLEAFEKLIYDTSEKIKRLGELDHTPEIESGCGFAIDIGLEEMKQNKAVLDSIPSDANDNKAA